jgi:hypothetical protein
MWIVGVHVFVFVYVTALPPILRVRRRARPALKVALAPFEGPLNGVQRIKVGGYVAVGVHGY